MAANKPRTLIGTGETGLAYHFLLTMRNGIGEETTEQYRVVATDTAEAWRKIGEWVYVFMRGPKGRRVTDVQLME